jgi:hypothetical protein
LEAAKKYADTNLSESMSAVNGAFVYKGTVTSESELPALSASTLQPGHVYAVAGDGFTIDSAKLFEATKVAKVEAGDMIIATGTSQSNLKWAVIQRNIDGAVTIDSNLATGALVLGGSSSTSVQKLANPTTTKEQVLRYTNGSIAWGNDTPNRAVKIITNTNADANTTTDILAAASTNDLIFKSGQDVYISKDSDNRILIDAHKYTVDGASISYSTTSGSKLTTFNLPTYLDNNGVSTGGNEAKEQTSFVIPKLTMNKFGIVTAASDVSVSVPVYTNGAGIGLTSK